MGFGENSRRTAYRGRNNAVAGREAAAVALVIVCIVGIIFSSLNVGFTKQVLCTESDSLNPSEQMWCSPPEKMSVTTKTEEHKHVSIFRIKKASAPKIDRLVSVNKNMTVKRNDHTFYSFVMNPGSSLTATLTTETYIKCYLLDHENMILFSNGEKFSYLCYSIGELKVESFHPNKSDTYFLGCAHYSTKGSSKARILYDMSFSYNVFDVSSVRSDCNNTQCTFDDVGTEEVIVADNGGTSKVEVTMNLPDEFAWLAFVLLLVFVFGLVAVLIIFPLSIRAAKKRSKPVKGVEERTHLANETTTPGSNETSTGIPSYNAL